MSQVNPLTPLRFSNANALEGKPGDPRWSRVIETYNTQQIRHVDVQTKGLILLDLLKRNYNLHYVGEGSGKLLRKCPQWTTNQGKAYRDQMMWEDVEYFGVSKVLVADKGNIVEGLMLGMFLGVKAFLIPFSTLLLGQIAANWQANGEPLSGQDPHLNFVQVYHFSPPPFGVNQLGLAWPVCEGLYFVKGGRGSSTFTQAGNVTPPHIDGFGLMQRMAHLSGDKVWIVWPPTRENITAARDNHKSIGASREGRLEVWLEVLKDPEVFLVRKGDSFILGPCVIHACISITSSAQGLGVIQEWNSGGRAWTRAWKSATYLPQ